MMDATLDLTNRFIKGLQEYTLTLQDIEKGGWRYCGGNKKRKDVNYFRLLYGDDVVFPIQTDHCVCGHKIQENCYITDGTSMLILGNVCIKKFVKKSGRTCGNCGGPHRNTKDNYCKRCREIIKVI